MKLTRLTQVRLYMLAGIGLLGMILVVYGLGAFLLAFGAVQCIFMALFVGVKPEGGSR